MTQASLIRYLVPKLSEQSQIISNSLIISLTLSELILLLKVKTLVLGFNLLIRCWLAGANANKTFGRLSSIRSLIILIFGHILGGGPEHVQIHPNVPPQNI